MFPYRSICSHMFLKIGVLKNFLTFTGKHLCWRLLLIKLQAWKLWTSLKRNSSTGLFRWLLQNFQKQLFLEHLLCLLLSIPKIKPLCDETASYDILKLFAFICVLIFQKKYRIHMFSSWRGTLLIDYLYVFDMRDMALWEQPFKKWLVIAN